MNFIIEAIKKKLYQKDIIESLIINALVIGALIIPILFPYPIWMHKDIIPVTTNLTNLDYCKQLFNHNTEKWPFYQSGYNFTIVNGYCHYIMVKIQ